MVAINFNKRRVYIRGDIEEAYRWVSDLFDAPHMLIWELPFSLTKEKEITPHANWTIEHNPKPLNERYAG